MFAKRKKERVLPEPQQVGEVLIMVMGKVSKGLKTLDGESAKNWSGHADDKKLHGAIKALCQVLLRQNVTSEVDPQLTDWLQFYREVFGLELDPASINLPAERDGFNWIVLVAKGLTRNAVFDRCRQRFGGKAWRYYNDLDKAVTRNDREPIETYVICVCDGIEADECHQNKSAKDATKAGIKGMTNLERMLLELWYHWKTSDHLDKENLTICSGSRYAVGHVPCAYWHDDEFGVGGVNPGFADDDWRVREVVS